jgi:hypothetical protein
MSVSAFFLCYKNVNQKLSSWFHRACYHLFLLTVFFPSKRSIQKFMKLSYGDMKSLSFSLSQEWPLKGSWNVFQRPFVILSKKETTEDKISFCWVIGISPADMHSLVCVYLKIDFHKLSEKLFLLPKSRCRRCYWLTKRFYGVTMVLNIFKWDAYQNGPNIFINNSTENRASIVPKDFSFFFFFRLQNNQRQIYFEQNLYCFGPVASIY